MVKLKNSKVIFGSSKCKVSFGFKYIKKILLLLIPLYTGNPLTDTLASSVDQDEMPHKAVFHQGLNCLQKKIYSGTEIHLNLKLRPLDMEFEDRVHAGTCLIEFSPYLWKINEI